MEEINAARRQTFLDEQTLHDRVNMTTATLQSIGKLGPESDRTSRDFLML